MSGQVASQMLNYFEDRFLFAWSKEILSKQGNEDRLINCIIQYNAQCCIYDCITFLSLNSGSVLVVFSPNTCLSRLICPT